MIRPSCGLRQADVISYSATMSACEKASQWESILDRWPMGT